MKTTISIQVIVTIILCMLMINGECDNKEEPNDTNNSSRCEECKSSWKSAAEVCNSLYECQNTNPLSLSNPCDYVKICGEGVSAVEAKNIGSICCDICEGNTDSSTAKFKIWRSKTGCGTVYFYIDGDYVGSSSYTCSSSPCSNSSAGCMVSKSVSIGSHSYEAYNSEQTCHWSGTTYVASNGYCLQLY